MNNKAIEWYRYETWVWGSKLEQIAVMFLIETSIRSIIKRKMLLLKSVYAPEKQLNERLNLHNFHHFISL